MTTFLPQFVRPTPAQIARSGALAQVPSRAQINDRSKEFGASGTTNVPSDLQGSLRLRRSCGSSSRIPR